MTITARAPVRIDFAGGWTDVPKFSSVVLGKVVNAAITVYTYVTVRKLSVTGTANNSGQPFGVDVDAVTAIRMYSADLDVYEEAASVKDIEYNGSLDLAKAACKQYGVEGVEIVTRSDAPPGSGLGTSASLGVALVTALSRFARKREASWRAADIAFRLETEELGLLSGTQDQYAAALGGINCFSCEGNTVYQDPLSIVDNMFYELEKRLVLCYTGRSRLSSDIHKNVYEAFDRGENRDPLNGLSYTGDLAKEAFEKQDISLLAEAISFSWTFQKALHTSITNEGVEYFFEAAKGNGMSAGKACGAGGGGCLLFLAEKGREHVLRRALQQAGGTIINFSFDLNGVVSWVS